MVKFAVFVPAFLSRAKAALDALVFGTHGPDHLVGWLVRADAEDQALISTVYWGRLAHGPEGARGDYHPAERAAWRERRRWRLEVAWGLMVLLQDHPGLVFADLILLAICVVTLVNNLVMWIGGWFV